MPYSCWWETCELDSPARANPPPTCPHLAHLAATEMSEISISGGTTGSAGLHGCLEMEGERGPSFKGSLATRAPRSPPRHMQRHSTGVWFPKDVYIIFLL